MATVLTPPRISTPPGNGSNGGRGNDFGTKHYGGGDGREFRNWNVPAHTYRTGMWMALAAIVMLFASFTSALIVRKGGSNDWTTIVLPRVLYFNTAILLASSVTLEVCRKALTAGRGSQFKVCLYVTTILGIAFIGGQVVAWRELASHGVYLSTNPSSSFFYLLTAAHGLHLLGGVAALFYLVLRAPRLASGLKKRVAVDVTAIYWHFMDGLWIYLLLLLTVRL